MKKIKIVFWSFLGLVLIVVLIFFIFGYLKPKYAGIFIDTDPASSVYIDGEQVGHTPYKKTLKPKEVEIKLVPDSFQVPLSPFETKIDLIPGVETVVRREFGETDELSSGEIISFEKTAKDETSLSVISIPDSAKLVIDRRDKAFTPHKTSVILPGVHVLEISADGFSNKEIQVRAYKGYKLTTFIKLARKVEEEVSQGQTATNSAEIISGNEKKMVKIKATPTGFLRVRDEPSSLGNEVGRVIPGELYVLMEKDEKTGWYKIEFTENDAKKTVRSGWISNQYAQIMESSKDLEASPSAKNP